MKTDRELLEQALGWIDDLQHYTDSAIFDDSDRDNYDELQKAIRARLAEDDDEPVAWIYDGWDYEGYVSCRSKQTLAHDIPLFRRPQPKARLTDEEINDCFDMAQRNFHKHQSGIKGQQLTIQDWLNWHFARAIEQKIWEKNREL